MRETGYEKRGGVWTDEDGEKINCLRFTSASDNAILGRPIAGSSPSSVSSGVLSLEGEGKTFDPYEPTRQCASVSTRNTFGSSPGSDRG